jgi:hypothetical protein
LPPLATYGRIEEVGVADAGVHQVDIGLAGLLGGRALLLCMESGTTSRDTARAMSDVDRGSDSG